LKRNFQFDGMSVVRWGDQHIDLHNAYDLESCGTSLTGDAVEICFKRNAHAIDPNSLPREVTLRCAGDVRIAFNDLCEIAVPVTNEGVEIAYFDEGCDWNSWLNERMAQRQGASGLHLSLGDGFAIRIFCNQVTFSAEERMP